MRILFTGADGQLGQQFSKIKRIEGIDYFFTSKNDIDITDLSKVSSYILDNRISHIINCAAYTNVDKAEINNDIAFNVNFNGVNNLIKTVEINKISLIHFSTDYVYSGINSKPIKENEFINPINFYGYSKREGEKLIQKSNSNSIIIRTSWLYSKFGNNFVKKIIQKSMNRKKIKVVNDQFGCPTNAEDLVNTTMKIIYSENFFEKRFKEYNFSNEGHTSWYEFAKKIIEFKKINCEVVPITSSELKHSAKRPKYLNTDKSRIKNEFNLDILNWQESLRNFCKSF